MQAVCDRLVEALLQLNRAATVQCDLQKNAVVGSVYAEIVPVERQPTLAMFSDDLETIVIGDTENI